MSEPAAFDELPELMLSLRSLGSRRGRPNEPSALTEDQDRFFEPLLEGRRTAAQAISRLQVMAAFDSRRLTGLMDATVRAFATERFGTRAPARRAFEAELFEIVEPLRAALQVLGSLAESMSQNQGGSSPDDGWTLWLAQLRVVFHVADSSWPQLCDVLEATPRATSTSGRWRFPSSGDHR